MRDFGTLASIVRQSVSALTAGRDLGLMPDRDGKCRCIFHADKRPSLKLYDGTGGYYCFVCGAHGDVVDLTAAAMGCRKSYALRQLNSMYHLGLPVDGSQDEKRLQQARKAAEERAQAIKDAQTRTETLEKAVWDAFTRWMDWRLAVSGTAPDGPSDPITDDFAKCVWEAEKAREDFEHAQDELFGHMLEQQRQRRGVMEHGDGSHPVQ